MPWIEITTREPLSQEQRASLAQALSDTVQTVEFGKQIDKVSEIDWMRFSVIPAESWAVGGRFDGKYEKGRAFASARIIAPEGLMTPDHMKAAMKGVAQHLAATLGMPESSDRTGIWVVVEEIKEGQWFSDDDVQPVLGLVDKIGQGVSPERQQDMKAKLEGQKKMREAFAIPY